MPRRYRQWGSFMCWRVGQPSTTRPWYFTGPSRRSFSFFCPGPESQHDTGGDQQQSQCHGCLYGPERSASCIPGAGRERFAVMNGVIGSEYPKDKDSAGCNFLHLDSVSKRGNTCASFTGDPFPMAASRRSKVGFSPIAAGTAPSQFCFASSSSKSAPALAWSFLLGTRPRAGRRGETRSNPAFLMTCRTNRRSDRR